MAEQEVFGGGLWQWGLLLAMGCGLTSCVTERALPDGVHPRREVLAYTPDDRPPRLSSPPISNPVTASVPSHELLAEEPIFPPGLLSPPLKDSTAGVSGNYQNGEEAIVANDRFSHNSIRSKDGRLTRLYWVRAGSALNQIIPLIVDHTDATDEDISVMPDMLSDPRPSAFPKELESMIPGTQSVADLILVSGTEEVLLEVDQFMSAILTQTPQIEIEARVVEIKFEKGMEYGTNLFIQDSGSVGGDSTALGELLSPLDPDAFLRGDQVGSLALAFFNSDLKFEAIIRAIQNSTNTDVLSAPKMAVLNGHRAVIDTGSRIPVQTPVLGAAGQLTQVQVKFEETGVKLIVTPYLLMDDTIQVDVMADVSFVSSYIESGATGILNPIISNRTASTVVNVRDGQTFGIGGLIATDEIELVSKVPFLGDIPILGYLFRTRSIEERQSQVIFFITPRIVRQSAPMFDPGI